MEATLFASVDKINLFLFFSLMKRLYRGLQSEELIKKMLILAFGLTGQPLLLHSLFIARSYHFYSTVRFHLQGNAIRLLTINSYAKHIEKHYTVKTTVRF